LFLKKEGEFTTKNQMENGWLEKNAEQMNEKTLFAIVLTLVKNINRQILPYFTQILLK